MNILLTGGSGFVGNRLAHLLREQLNEFSNVVLLTSRKNDQFNCVKHKNYSYTSDELLINGITYYDVVIHAGAYAPKTAGIEDAAKNFSSLANTQYLLSHLPNIPDKIVYLSSAAVYTDFSAGEYKPSDFVYTEETAPEPENQYGLVKYSAELLIGDWAKRNGVNCDILRLSSIYGADDTRRQMMNIMMEQALEGKGLKLYASPGMVRNQLYVDDCCRFIMNSAVSVDQSYGVINLASSNHCTLEDIVKAIVAATGNQVNYQVDHISGKGKDMRLSAKKREELLGKERISLTEGVKATYAWMKNRYGGR